MSDIGDLATNVFSNLDSVPLPPVVKKNLLKSISRLITGIVDWPAAYFNAKAQQIDSKADALSLVTKAASEAAAKEFKTDQFLINRTVEHFGARLLGAQINRETTVRLAVEDLKLDPPKEDVDKEIDTDWLDMFSRISETKSNKDVQLFLSKILAGEIRSPGTFSQKTIHTLSILDQKAAQLFQVFCNLSYSNCTTDDQAFLISEPFGSAGDNALADLGLEYSNLTVLQDAGLIQNTLTSWIKLTPFSFALEFTIGNNSFQLKPTTEMTTEKQKVSIINFTRVGIELRKVIHISNDPNYEKEFFKWVMEKFKIQF